MQLKLVVAGPQGVGKTVISNFLASQTDKLVGDSYNPTSGVRILEFETKVRGVQEMINIELWDSSGDHQFDSCWKAIMYECDGVILVYNPDSPGQDQQIGVWFDYFVKQNGLKDDQCLVYAHRSNPGAAASDRFRPPPLFSKVSAALTNHESEADIRSLFDNFVKEVHTVRSKQGNLDRK